MIEEIIIKWYRVWNKEFNMSVKVKQLLKIEKLVLILKSNTKKNLGKLIPILLWFAHNYH